MAEPLETGGGAVPRPVVCRDRWWAMRFRQATRKDPVPNIGYATPDADSPLSEKTFERRAVGANDVRIDIAFCGVCHSDVHQARDELPGEALQTNFPCMPGHEITGTVAEVGENVTKFSEGDRVGVGCMVDSCGHCKRCKAGLEQFCLNGFTLTYNTPDPDSGEPTYGGYSDGIVVTEDFVLRIPDEIPLEKAAPLLCAGITTFSPLKHWDIGSGHRIGVAGIGGLGNMAIKLAKALGATVVALTTTPEKTDKARELGADEVIVMGEEEAVAENAASLDFILSTIPEGFDPNPYLGLLALDGELVSVGCLEPLSDPPSMDTMVISRLSVGASFIGGIPETQEVLDFCVEHDIAADIEVVDIGDINAVFDKVNDGDVHHRFVIDSSTLPAAA